MPIVAIWAAALASAALLAFIGWLAYLRHKLSEMNRNPTSARGKNASR